jgi:hypothetical protein
MGVDLFVERVEFWVVGFDRFLDRGLETDNIDLRDRRRKANRAQRGGRQQGFGKPIHGNNAP